VPDFLDGSMDAGVPDGSNDPDGGGMPDADRPRDDAGARISVSICPENPNTTDSLRADFNGNCADQEEPPNISDRRFMPPNLSFTWWRDQMHQEDISTTTVAPSQTEKGQTWQVRVISTNLMASIGESQTTTIANSPPEISSLTITPANAKTHDDIRVEVLASSDADDDLVQFSYEWQKNSMTTMSSSVTVGAALTAKGDTWTVLVTPHDGETAGPQVSTDITIANSPPNQPLVQIEQLLYQNPHVWRPFPSGECARPDEVFSCTSTQTPTDPDGDIVTVRAQWRQTAPSTRDVTLPAELSTPSLLVFPQESPSNADIFECVITASDDDATSVATSTTRQTIEVCEKPHVITFENPPHSRVYIPDTNLLDLQMPSTIELWILWDKNPAENSGGYIFDRFNNGQSSQTSFLLTHAGTAQFLFDTSITLYSSTQVQPQTWTHLAAVLSSSGAVSLFVNGVREDGGQMSASHFQEGPRNFGDGYLGDNTNLLWSYNNGDSFRGSVADFRFSTNARYTSNFTPSRDLTVDFFTQLLFKFNDKTISTSTVTEVHGYSSGSMNPISGWTYNRDLADIFLPQRCLRR
jgi:hypothetical protein